MAGFDPDAYLKTKGGFDPDAYLKSKAPPQATRVPLTPERQADVDRQVQAGTTPTPSGWERLKDAASEGLNTAGSFMEGVNRRFSMGAIPAVERLLGVRDKSEALRQHSPRANVLGESTGTGLGLVAGPGAAAGKVGAAIASRAPVGPATRVLMGGGAAGALEEAGNAVADGEAPQEWVTRAGKGAILGAAGATVAKGVGTVGDRILKAIRNPRTQAGQMRGVLDRMEASGTTRADVEAADEAAGLMAGKAGTGERAYELGEQFMKHNEGVAQSARAKYSEGLADIVRSNPNPVDLTPVHAQLDDVVRVANNGEVIDKDVAAAVQDVKRLLTEAPTPPSRVLGPDGAPAVSGMPGGRAMGTLQDLRAAKEYVADRAQFGQVATKENVPYRKLYMTLSESAKGIDPRLRGLDAEYAQTMDRLERANDIMFGRATPEVEGRAAAQVRAGNTLGRQMEATKPAGVRAKQMKELEELDMAYGPMIGEMDERIALQGTEFGLPNIHQGFEMAGTSGIIRQNANALLTRPVNQVGQEMSAVGKAPAAPLTATVGERLRAAKDADKERSRKLKRR